MNYENKKHEQLPEGQVPTDQELESLVGDIPSVAALERTLDSVSSAERRVSEHIEGRLANPKRSLGEEYDAFQVDAEYAEFVRQQNAGPEGTPDNSTRSRGKGAFRKFFGKIFRTQR